MYRFFLCLIFFFNIFNYSYGEQKIAYIDMDRIIKSSIAGQNIIKKISNKIDKEKNNLSEEAKLIKDEEQDLIKKKNVLSEKEFQERLNLLKKKINEYQIKKKQTEIKINKIKLKSTNELLEKINPIIANYAAEKEISIILRKQQMVIGKSNLDISEDILKIINKKIN